MKPGSSSGVPDPEYVAEILPEHLPAGRLSIAVFGPGEGEAIVVRLPDGAVGVVDGCREPARGDTKGRGDPVRELLQKLAAASPAPDDHRLAFVCLTHPHADHYGGLGRLLQAYEGRVDSVWTVTHVTQQYATALPAWVDLTRAGKVPYPDDQDLAGLTRVIDAFHQASGACSLLHLSNGKPLMRKSIDGQPLVIEACGPSDNDVERASKELVRLITAAAKGMELTGRHDPNLTSGALLLRWGTSAVLLAGDLLVGPDPRSGWQRARDHVVGTVRVVNVAHHASEEAHDGVLWDGMKPGLAIVTPFKHATGSQPPRLKQIEALARSAVVAITSPPAWVGQPGAPTALRAVSLRTSSGKIAAPIVLSRTPDARRNAVAVSLDAAGDITRFVLAGKADVYLTAGDVAPASASSP